MCALVAAHLAQAQLQATITGFSFGGTGTERIVDAVSDELGNSYILGTFMETMVLGNTTLDWSAGSTFLAKLGPDDQWGWAHPLPVLDPLALALHPEGGFIILSGAMLPWESYSTISKWNADATTMEWTAGPDVYPFAFFPPAEVVVDDAGNIYCSIQVNSSNLVWDGITTAFTGDIGTFIGKLGLDHQLQWAYQFGVIGATNCWSNETVGNSLLLDGDDGVWLSGHFSGDESLFADTVLYAGDGSCTLSPFVCHLSPEGVIDWLLGNDPGSSGGESTHSCLTPNGDLFYWCGTVGAEGTSSFSLGGLTTDEGMFSAVINASGACLSLQHEGGHPGFSIDDLLLGPADLVLLVGQGYAFQDYTTAPMLWIRQSDSLYNVLQQEDTLDRRMTKINRTSPSTFRIFGHFGNDLFLPTDTLHSIGDLDAAVLEVELDPDMGAPETSRERNSLHCAPVPFETFTVLSSDEPFAHGTQLRMHDALGRLVHERTLNGGRSINIQRNALPAGVYVITVGLPAEPGRALKVVVE